MKIPLRFVELISYPIKLDFWLLNPNDSALYLGLIISIIKLDPFVNPLGD